MSTVSRAGPTRRGQNEVGEAADKGRVVVAASELANGLFHAAAAVFGARSGLLLDVQEGAYEEHVVADLLFDQTGGLKQSAASVNHRFPCGGPLREFPGPLPRPFVPAHVKVGSDAVPGRQEQHVLRPLQRRQPVEFAFAFHLVEERGRLVEQLLLQLGGDAFAFRPGARAFELARPARGPDSSRLVQDAEDLAAEEGRVFARAFEQAEAELVQFAMNHVFEDPAVRPPCGFALLLECLLILGRGSGKAPGRVRPGRDRQRLAEVAVEEILYVSGRAAAGPQAVEHEANRRVGNAAGFKAVDELATVRAAGAGSGGDLLLGQPGPDGSKW